MKTRLVKTLVAGTVMVLVAAASVVPCFAVQDMSEVRPSLTRIETVISNGSRVTTQDITYLKTVSISRDFFLRARAITTLSYVKEAPGRKVAMEVAHNGLRDNEWLVRHAALNALRRQQAPDLRQIGQQMISDPSAEVRAAAKRIQGNLKTK